MKGVLLLPVTFQAPLTTLTTLGIPHTHTYMHAFSIITFSFGAGN